MTYTPYYPAGWDDSPNTSTPIIAAALDNMESGIGAATAKSANLSDVESAPGTQSGVQVLCQRVDSGSMATQLISTSLITNRWNDGSPPSWAECWQVCSDPFNTGAYLLVGWLPSIPVFGPGHAF